MAIFLNGRTLDSYIPCEVVRMTSQPQHQIYEGGGRMDYYRNLHLIALFGVDEQINIPSALERWNDVDKNGYSAVFKALRLGETLNFGIAHGIIDRARDRRNIVIPDTFRLVHREQQFELCGPAKRQRAVRVRGLDGPEGIIAANIWQRELKRRERARKRFIDKHIDQLGRNIKEVLEWIPDAQLDGVLERFAVGGNKNFADCNLLIADGFRDLEIDEADAVFKALDRMRWQAFRIEHDAREMMRKANADADLADIIL